jgi:hypothetical protein
MKSSNFNAFLIHFFLLTLLTACSKKSDPAPAKIDSKAEFVGNLENVPFSYIVPNTLFSNFLVTPYTQIRNNYTNNSNIDTITYISSITSIYGSSPIITLTTGKNLFNNSASLLNNIEYKNHFAKGAYKFKTSQQDGIEISCYDENMEESWYSYTAGADQSKSTISIINTQDYLNLGMSQLQVTYQIQCYVYNSSGDKKILTGTLKTLFTNGY